MPLRIAPLLWLTCLLSACVSPTHIHNNGVKHLYLGSAMPDSSKQSFRGHTMRDTVFEGEGYRWHASVIDYPSGLLIVEEDFFGDNLINRIRIETPDFTFQKQIRVGSKLAELKNITDNWVITHLPDYRRVDVFTAGIHFLISDENLGDRLKTKKNPEPDDLDLEEKIVAIVLM